MLVANCNNIFDEPLVEDTKINYYISKAGYTIKNGFNWVGKKVASGISSSGNYIE
jgi:hypothetical protein